MERQKILSSSQIISSIFTEREKKTKTQPDRSENVIPVVTSCSNNTKYKQYKESMIDLLKLELEDEISQLEKRLQSWIPKKLQREGLCLMGLKCKIGKEVERGGVCLSFSVSRDDELNINSLAKNRFQIGDTLIISKDDQLRENVTGVLVDKRDMKISVLVDEVPKNADKCEWRVDKGLNSYVYERMIIALEKLTSKEGGNCDIRGMICNTEQNMQEAANKPPEFNRRTRKGDLRSGVDWTKEVDFTDLNLNPSQKEAINSAVRRRLTLIQGPPGTGKTRTAVLLLRKLIEFHGSNRPTILATSDTNVAADNLLEGLVNEGIRAVRVGQYEKVRKTLRDFNIRELARTAPESKLLEIERKTCKDMIEKLEVYRSQLTEDFSDLRGLISESSRRAYQLQEEITVNVLKEAQVIVTTCIGSGQELLSCLNFEIVLIDEATHATEPTVLVPLVQGARQVILLGDHFQLPPTVKSFKAAEGGLSKSLFQRFAENGIRTHLLNKQYRMHPSLSLFPSIAFYKGLIKDGIRAEDRALLGGFEFPCKGHPVAFYHVNGLESITLDGTISNSLEATKVLEITRKLISCGVLSKDIGIITPYSGQVRLLTSSLAINLPQATDLDVNSVDGYQGREKEVIVFSAVRSNPRGKIGFLADWRRLNVTLTRGRCGLIVIGNSETLSHDKYWNQYISWVTDSNLMVMPSPSPSPSQSPSPSPSAINKKRQPPAHNQVALAATPKKQKIRNKRKKNS